MMNSPLKESNPREIKAHIIFYLIGCLVFLGLVFISIFTTNQKEEKARLREQHERSFLEQAEKEADEKIQIYATTMEEALQSAGLSDATVSWSKMDRENYESYYGSTGLCYTDYRYYYKINYQSDEISDIFEQHMQAGMEEELFWFMRRLLDEKQKNDFESGTVDNFELFDIGEESVAYFIEDDFWYWEVGFETSEGQSYMFKRDENGGRLYQNDDLIYEKPNTTGSNTSDTESTNSSNSNTYFDPYNVQDYDDGDVFADEWAEEFSDSHFGSYDYGYEDAYDYWEEEHGY